MPKRKSPPRIARSEYRNYINSDAWREKKKQYRASKLPQSCLVCGDKTVDLHHRTYKRLGNEWLNDLIPICRDHHNELHDYKQTSGMRLWGASRNFVRYKKGLKKSRCPHNHPVALCRSCL